MLPNSIFLTPVDEKEISDMFSKIDSSKSCGPNSISSNLLKTHAKAFFFPVKDMINSSFSEGKFPSILKIAQVCTVFKKGERDLRENYRPISTTIYKFKKVDTAGLKRHDTRENA